MFALSSDTFLPLPISRSTHVTYKLDSPTISKQSSLMDLNDLLTQRSQISMENEVVPLFFEQLLNDETRRLSVHSKGALHKDVSSNFGEPNLIEEMRSLPVIPVASMASVALSPSDGKVELLHASQMVDGSSIQNVVSVEHQIKGDEACSLKGSSVDISDRLAPVKDRKKTIHSSYDVESTIVEKGIEDYDAAADAIAGHKTTARVESRDPSCSFVEKILPLATKPSLKFFGGSWGFCRPSPKCCIGSDVNYSNSFAVLLEGAEELCQLVGSDILDLDADQRGRTSETMESDVVAPMALIPEQHSMCDPIPFSPSNLGILALQSGKVDDAQMMGTDGVSKDKAAQVLPASLLSSLVDRHADEEPKEGVVVIDNSADVVDHGDMLV
ncbi:hypothetical protein Nepgr_017962 [Nepenthes gracilis]|uniref:Uncharacterized protein n=1 Tax=Nepenthes gracilis TaxID=150966 RepID=A0AAD3SSZ2_NEPGR|nr:hypothetical protein Nepgr_017962 [Nepenthes gracilis]